MFTTGDWLIAIVALPVMTRVQLPVPVLVASTVYVSAATMFPNEIALPVPGSAEPMLTFDEFLNW